VCSHSQKASSNWQNASNIKDIMLAGADGAAVISAILGEKDIKEATINLKSSMGI